MFCVKMFVGIEYLAEDPSRTQRSGSLPEGIGKKKGIPQGRKRSMKFMNRELVL